MKHKHTNNQNIVPLGFFVFAAIMMIFAGWKLVFFLPLMLMFIAKGSCNNAGHRYAYQPVEVEKPKRKPKNDDYI